MQAVVLAGGFGTRLRTHVSDVPKPLAPIGGRPFLSYFLYRLEAHGFDSAVISVGYMADKIIEVLGSRHGRMNLRYAVETEPLGTGGGLRQSLAMVDHFPAFAFNGDTYAEIDYDAMLATHRTVTGPLTVAVRQIEDASRYGRAKLDGGRICAFEGGGDRAPGYINCGTYIFESNVLDSMPKAFSFEKDYLEAQVGALRPAAYVTSSYFIDIGVPEDFLRAQAELPGRLPQS